MKRGFYTIKNEDGSFDTYEMPAKKTRSTPYKSKKAPKSSYGKKQHVEGYVKGRYTTGNKATEIKAVNYSAPGVTIGAATSIVLDLTAGIAEGTAVNQRVGQQITCTSVDVEANFYIPTTNVSTQNFYSWYIILDKQPNNGTALASDIFTNSNSNLNQRTLLNQDRFVVLASEYNSENLSTQGRTGQRHKRFIKTAITSRFSDSTTAPNTNAILFVTTSNAQVAPSVILVDYVIRLRYADE